MAKVGKALESVLEGCASFLRERMLAPLRHQPYLVRCVQGVPFLCQGASQQYFRTDAGPGYRRQQRLQISRVATGILFR